MICANCGATAVITSTTYRTIVELFDEYSTPFSPEVMSLIMTPTSILNDIIGASLSEPHTDEFAVEFVYIYYILYIIYFSYVVP